MATYYVDGSVGNDSNAGTSAGSGNAWLTIAKATSTVVAGDTVYVKASATYSISSGITSTIGSAFAALTRFIGYTTTTTDGGQVTVSASANLDGLTVTGGAQEWRNFIFNANGHTGTGLTVTGGNWNMNFTNCRFTGWSTGGINISVSSGNLLSCKIDSCGGNSIVGAVVYGCTFSGNSSYLLQTSGHIVNCLIINTSGTYGIYQTYGAGVVMGCVIYGNGSSGLFRDTWHMSSVIMNNIFVNNGAFGIDWPTALQYPLVDYNAFYNNTSGARNNVLAGAHDVTLSGDPFTNPSGDDFSLNNTAGAGAACRAAGFPQSIP